MTLALAHSRARTGVHAPSVRVEVYLAPGLPALNIVGLPEAAVRESRDRVRAAIQCAQLEFPSRRITVNLAPADLPKDGGRFDLPIALGILAANGVMDVNALAGIEFLGELSLTGELRPVDGVLPAALQAAREGRALVVPAGNGGEAALAAGVRAYTARTLLEVVAHLQGDKRLPLAERDTDGLAPLQHPDLADVRGQAQARRALEIAAAGAHHLLLIGPPGCGKTLLASRLPGLLPPATEAEALESAVVTSVSGRGLDLARWRLRAFRAPHHTASAIALAGGGPGPRPGEISLAHHGVLFLDELADVRGQAQARRALEIAAAGAHHLLLIGPPGCGKTLLASRLPGLLPPATEAEALESAVVTSVSGRGLDLARWRLRAFRAPHHTASAIALAGGGSGPRPGEISLAHHGVLFLDELAEWGRHALEVLRQPLESGTVTISRAGRMAEFPARFQLVAAMNPCPCGWAGDPSGRCRCTVEAVLRYRHRLSGPLLDRIDLQVPVPRLAPAEMRGDAPRGEDSATVRARVLAARERQLERAGVTNANLTQADTDRHCRLHDRDVRLLERAMQQMQLSARATQRILRVARTIADLAGHAQIDSADLTEAIGYRQLDREALLPAA